MPKITRKSGPRKNSRTSQPNVFVQSESPDESRSVGQTAVTTTSSEAAPRTRARVERTTRRAGIRSEIYTRSLTSELKKIGALSGGIIVVLVALTIAL